MNTCKHCQKHLAEDETIYTDYFQVNREGADVYTLCGPCYLKDVDKYLAEEKPLCQCGAPEIRYFADDDDETIGMAIHEAYLNLVCSEAKRRIDAGETSEEEIEDEDFHTLNSMFYIRWFTDEEMGWV